MTLATSSPAWVVVSSATDCQTQGARSRLSVVGKSIIAGGVGGLRCVASNILRVHFADERSGRLLERVRSLVRVLSRLQ